MALDGGSREIVWGDGHKQKPRIKWAEQTGLQEVLHPHDKLLVHPSWFAGVEQNDTYSCAYLVLTALERMQKDTRQFGITGITEEEAQSRVVETHGLDRLLRYIQEDREDPLSVHEFRRQLRDLASQEAKVFTSRVDLSFIEDDMSQGEIAIEALKRGYGVGLEVHNEGHLVLAIGLSSEGGELICWDSLSGNPDINHPTSRLRRLPVDNPEIYIWGGLMLSEKYKSPKAERAQVQPDVPVEASNKILLGEPYKNTL